MLAELGFPRLLEGLDGAAYSQSTETLLELLPAWVACQAVMPLPNSANKTPPSASLGSGGQVGNYPRQTHKWFIRTRVTVTQVGQEHGAAGLPLKSLVLPWGPRTQPLLFLCWLTASGSGLLGAEPRQRASLALAVCSGAEVLRAGHLPSAPVLIELES